MATSKSCFQCGKQGEDLEDMFGHIICEACKSRLGLFTDETVRKHIRLYESEKDHSYEEEIRNRLTVMEKDYIKKRIKLLHIQEQLKNI